LFRPEQLAAHNEKLLSAAARHTLKLEFASWLPNITFIVCCCSQMALCEYEFLRMQAASRVKLLQILDPQISADKLFGEQDFLPQITFAVYTLHRDLIF